MDLQQAEGKARLHELCATADVIVEKCVDRTTIAPTTHAWRCPWVHPQQQSSSNPPEPRPLVADRAPARRPRNVSRRYACVRYITAIGRG